MSISILFQNKKNNVLSDWQQESRNEDEVSSFEITKEIQSYDGWAYSLYQAFRSGRGGGWGVQPPANFGDFLLKFYKFSANFAQYSRKNFKKLNYLRSSEFFLAESQMKTLSGSKNLQKLYKLGIFCFVCGRKSHVNTFWQNRQAFCQILAPRTFENNRKPWFVWCSWLKW